MEIYVNSNSSAWNFIMLLRIVHSMLKNSEHFKQQVGGATIEFQNPSKVDDEQCE